MAGGDLISASVRPTLLLRSVRVEDPWWGPSRVTFTGPLSNGDLRQFRYDVRSDWQAHVRADGMLVQSDRWWWLEPVLKGAALLGIGYVAGAL